MRFLSIVKSAENQGPPPQALLDAIRSEEHTSELQSLAYLVCRLLLEKKTCALPIRSEEHTSELQSLAYLVCRLLLEKQKLLVYTTVITFHPITFSASMSEHTTPPPRT